MATSKRAAGTRTTRSGARAAPPARSARKARARLADTGVPSPYAMAEVITRRHIDWDAVGNRRALLEEIFQTPYSDLFDPANGSPLYIGQALQGDGSVKRQRPDFARPEAAREVPANQMEGVRNLAQLVERLGSSKLAEIPVRNVLPGLNSVHVELGETVAARDVRWERLFDESLIEILFPSLTGYHPAGYTWQDAGRFYNEAVEFLDPIQGAVGDCYFIAAMSSVAWAMPFVIADRNRATGMDNEQFTHQIGFHGSKGVENVEVTDQILLGGGGYTHFCRSKEAGEIWPAVYEKAYAKWRLDEATDFPAIPNIAGGDASMACAALTGLSDYRNWHDSFTASEILQLVQNHCSNGRTTTPMVSWTFGSGEQGDVAYRDANVVAGHAYSVLGWMRRSEFFLDQFDPADIIPHYVPIDWPIPIPDPGPLMRQAAAGAAPGRAGRASPSSISSLVTESAFTRLHSRQVDYIVLRNPWGYCEATGPSVAAGDDRALDVDWWRSIPLGTDGVFAMEVNAYHRYFAGTGGAH
jgi:hypothetical protein